MPEQKQDLLKTILPHIAEDGYSTIIENLYDGVYITDKERRILYWNKGAEDITGFTKKDVLNKFCYDSILSHVDKDGQPLCFVACPLLSCLGQNKNIKGRIYLSDKNRNRIPVDVVTTPLKDDKGEIIGAVEVFRDAKVYERLEREKERLNKLSIIDPLTSIYNRRYIMDKLKQELERAKRFSHPLSILMADIDHFKKVNDTFGHPAGDIVLKEIAMLLEQTTRAIDFVGRYGGEEFIVILPHTDSNGAMLVAEKVRKKIAETKFPKVGTVTISIGAAVAIKTSTIKTLVQQVDSALYMSKKSGRNRLTLHE